MSATVQPVDQVKLDEFMGRAVADLGAALSAALVVIGDRLGLYRAMADGDPVSADELAGRTGAEPRGGVARTPSRPVRRHRAVLPPGLRRQPDVVLDPRPGGHPGQARGRGPRRRRGLRSWRFHSVDGGGVSAVGVRRLRLPRGVDRARAPRPRRPDWKAACGSRSPRPSSIRARGTTWCACSTACTTWATRSARLRTCSARSPMTGRG
jgi:hypothetical protein